MKTNNINILSADMLARKISDFPVKIKSIIHIKGRPGYENELILRPYFEMMYIKRGRINTFISGNNVTLISGSIIIISPETEYMLTVNSPTCEIVIFSFNQTYNFLKTDSYALLRPSPKNEIICLVERLAQNNNSCDVTDEILTGIYSVQLFIYIERLMSIDYETKVHFFSDSDSIIRAKNYIDKNFRKDIGIFDIAEYVFLSESYLAHLFKNKYGISIKKYIIKKRMELAKDLLLTTDYSSAAISEKVGFSSPQRFNDIFKKIYGTTPLSYRKKYRYKTFSFRKQ